MNPFGFGAGLTVCAASNWRCSSQFLSFLKREREREREGEGEEREGEGEQGRRPMVRAATAIRILYLSRCVRRISKQVPRRVASGECYEASPCSSLDRTLLVWC